MRQTDYFKIGTKIVHALLEVEYQRILMFE